MYSTSHQDRVRDSGEKACPRKYHSVCQDCKAALEPASILEHLLLSTRLEPRDSLMIIRTLSNHQTVGEIS